MAYVRIRPYVADRLPDLVRCDAQVEMYQQNRSYCSEQFRRRGVRCGPPVIEALTRAVNRDGGVGRWWVLCQWHADRRGVWQLPVQDEEQLALALNGPWQLALALNP